MIYVLLFLGWGQMSPSYLGEYTEAQYCNNAKSVVLSRYNGIYVNEFKERLVCFPSGRKH